MCFQATANSYPTFVNSNLCCTKFDLYRILINVYLCLEFIPRHLWKPAVFVTYYFLYTSYRGMSIDGFLHV